MNILVRILLPVGWAIIVLALAVSALERLP